MLATHVDLCAFRCKSTQTQVERHRVPERILYQRWIRYCSFTSEWVIVEQDHWETIIAFLLHNRWELYLQTHLIVQHCAWLASKNPICSICIDIEEVDLVNLRNITMAMIRWCRPSRRQDVGMPVVNRWIERLGPR